MRIPFPILFASSLLAGAVSGMPPGLLVAGSGRAALIGGRGETLWERRGCGNIHRAWLRGDRVFYSNGDLRCIDLKTGEDRLFYRPCAKEGVFGFEILANGNVVAFNNGNDRVVELDGATGGELAGFGVDPGAPGVKLTPHHHLRMGCKTPAGTYLVCCSGSNFVREYDAKGALVWEQATKELPFDCRRRANGNTLVSHLSAVSEFTPDHRVAWSFACAEKPELKLANLCGIQELPNGNLVIGTYANGRPDRSRCTALEITRDKRVVWSYNAPDGSMMSALRIDPGRWPVALAAAKEEP